MTQPEQISHKYQIHTSNVYASSLSGWRRGLFMPWLVINELRRLFALPFIRAAFALHGVKWGHDWSIYGMPLIQRCGGSHIELGDKLEMRSWRETNPLIPWRPVVLATRTPQAQIRIGREVGITGATIVAAERIEIGNRVLIGANTTIVDTNFHPLDPRERQIDILAGKHAPVIIEDDVFIGMQSIILKGVRIGSGSVVGAGSVVNCNVPSGVIVAGNPAQVVRVNSETCSLSSK